jgi:hypothetical protein
MHSIGGWFAPAWCISATGRGGAGAVYINFKRQKFWCDSAASAGFNDISFTSLFIMRIQLIALTAAAVAACSQAGSLPALTALSSAPMRFEPATAASTRFLARGLGYQCTFTPDRAIVSAGDDTIELQFVGAAPAARLEGLGRLRSTTAVLHGRDASKWRTGIANFARLRVRHLYPGIDLVYYGNAGRLEYDFIVRAGADPRQIRMRLTGDRPRLDGSGDLQGRLTLKRPVAYQIAASDARRSVRAAFRQNPDGSYGVALGDYDRQRELVIDPVLTFSHYSAGASGDYATAVGHDASGFLYIGGTTYSSELPTTDNSRQPTKNAAADLFVVKLDPSNGQVVYSTFIGGSGNDILTGMAVQPDGSVFLTGTTASTDFPLGNAAQSSRNGDTDAFVFWLNPAESGAAALYYGTYLGGSGDETGGGIAIDSAGRVYVTGSTTSNDFPIAGGYQPASAGSSDAFFAFIDTTQSAQATLAYSTYIGGSGWDDGHAVAAGPNGKAWVAGATWSGDFPIVGQAYQSSYHVGGDAWVMEIDPRAAGGSSVLYSTYLGGSDQDGALAISADAAGRVAVAGWTLSTDFPVTASTAAQPQLAGGADAFVALLDPAQAAPAQLAYSTFYGGNDGEVPLSIARDSSGALCVAGYTFSTNLPITPDGMQALQAGGSDGFVLKLNPAAGGAAGLEYSSYVASSGTQIAAGVDVTNDGVIYVAGYTSGPLLETIGGAQKTTIQGDRDAYVFGFKLNAGQSTQAPSQKDERRDAEARLPGGASPRVRH